MARPKIRVKLFAERLVRGLLIVGLGLIPAGCADEFRSSGQQSLSGLFMFAAAGDGIGDDADQPVNSAYGSYLAGHFASQKQDLSTAANFMLEALKHDPDNKQLLVRSFLLVAGDGRFAKAVELARRLNSVDPNQVLAGLVLAVDAADRGAMEEADAVLARLPERGLNVITAPLLRGWLHLADGPMSGDRTSVALERLTALGDKKGFEVFHNLHVALMSDVAGQVEDARRAYEMTLKRAKQPSLRLVWLAGNFFERLGDGTRAAQIYREFLARNPGSTLVMPALRRAESGEKPGPVIAGVRDGMAEALFNLASILSQERAEELALVHVHMALRFKPDLDIARVLLGEILQAQDRGAEAIEVYRTISADSPFSWMVGLRLAEELERSEQVEEAIGELERLARAQPALFEPLFRLGNFLRGRERFEEAVSAYDRAASRLGAPTRRHWSLYYFRGIALERTSKWERAEKDFLRALELEPEQPFVMNYLAYSWVEKKLNFDRAKKMLARAVELRPDDGFIVDSLGWVHYRLGEYELGVTFLERAVELRPQDPTINDHLGDAYWRVGRRQEARFQWRRSMSLGPEADLAPTIEAKIKRGLPKSSKDI